LQEHEVKLRLLVWGLVLLLLAGSFALYLRPDFMVTLANQLWACF
jgi:cytochrome c oxidase subunit IV